MPLSAISVGPPSHIRLSTFPIFNLNGCHCWLVGLGYILATVILAIRLATLTLIHMSHNLPALINNNWLVNWAIKRSMRRCPYIWRYRRRENTYIPTSMFTINLYGGRFVGIVHRSLYVHRPQVYMFAMAGLAACSSEKCYAHIPTLFHHVPW